MPAGVGFDDVTVQWHIQQDDKPLVSSLGHVSDHVGLSVLDLDAWVAKLRRKGAKVPERVFQARRHARGDDRGSQPRSPGAGGSEVTAAEAPPLV